MSAEVSISGALIRFLGGGGSLDAGRELLIYHEFHPLLAMVYDSFQLYLLRFQSILEYFQAHVPNWRKQYF